MVADGELAGRARCLNQAFRKHARTGRPQVLFKSAMTLDGKVATRTGDSKWISGEDSRYRSHHWRAERDAVVVGIGTALADDPQLTARVGGRLPPAGAGGVRLRGAAAARLPARAERPRGAADRRRLARRLAAGHRRAGGRRGRGDRRHGRERAGARALGARSARRDGITSILLEGGPHLAGAFLDAGEVDEIRLFIAPVVVGGSNARDPLEGEGAERIAEAIRALRLDVERIGDDVLISARMREW